jgi:hypothetical protein
LLLADADQSESREKKLTYISLVAHERYIALGKQINVSFTLVWRLLLPFVVREYNGRKKNLKLLKINNVDIVSDQFSRVILKTSP